MVIFGDCIEKMKSLKDKSVDLIITDLPYGLTKNEKDKPINLNDFWKEVSRIKKKKTPILLFAQGLFYIDLVNSNRKWFKYDIIWDKILTTGFLNSKRMPLRSHEQIAVFYESPPVYNPQFKEGIPLHSKGKSWKDKDPTNRNYGDFKHKDDSRAGSTEKFPKSIWSYQKPHPSVALHRTEKPVSLLEELIKTYSNKGDLVLDATAGSGSTGEACINTERNFILIENDPECIKIIEKRLGIKKT